MRHSLAAALRLTCAIAVATASAFASPARAAPAPADQAAWHRDMAALNLPDTGCFRATFPERAWHAAACKAAPHRPYYPVLAGKGHHGRTVGNGADDALISARLISKGSGGFPVTTGLKSETGYGGAANSYSLELNSGFMGTPVCNSGNAGCQSWAQFIYSAGEQAVFIQYWLIGYGTTCPTTRWLPDGYGDCYYNSKAIAAPQFPITSLNTLTIYGYAVVHGADTIILTAGSSMYAVTAPDSVVGLATDWHQIEWNVFGDGGGSQANFSPGTLLVGRITVKNGTTVAPACAGNSGTSGETNNLKLEGHCQVYAGSDPSLNFVEGD